MVPRGCARLSAVSRGGKCLPALQHVCGSVSLQAPASICHALIAICKFGAYINSEEVLVTAWRALQWISEDQGLKIDSYAAIHPNCLDKDAMLHYFTMLVQDPVITRVVS